MQYKKILHTILIVVFLTQAHTTSLVAYRNSSCLAVPSIFKEARLVVHNNAYQLLKINEAYYIYMDTSGNVVHIYKTRDGWQGEHNGKQCTLTLDGHTRAPGDIVVYLLKKDYQIEKIADDVIHLHKREKHPIAMDEALPPEGIILTEFRKVLDEFSGSGIEETEEFGKTLSETREEIANIKRSKKQAPLLKIQNRMKELVPDISKMLCSSCLEVQLLGERLKDSIDLSAEAGSLHTMAGPMQNALDGSPLLLQKCLMEQIVIPIFESELRSVDDFFSITFVEEEGNNSGTLTLKGRTVAICKFYTKTNGVQFGIKMEIAYKEGPQSITKKYYVKSHQEYHISRNHSGHLSRTTQIIEPVNLKEIIVYTMLEKLNLGPKLHLMINPYARNSLFIVTEGLSPFEEGDTLEKGGYVPYAVSEKRAINQLDLVGRIFDLGDFNSGNFGMVTTELDAPQWKMIDFRVVKRYESISVNGYLQGNDLLDYQKGGIFARVLQGQEKYDKVQTGLDALRDLKEKKYFDKQLEDTFEEVFAYLQTRIPDLGMTVFEFLNKDLDPSKKKSLEEAKQELMEYQQNIEKNVKILYEGLANMWVERILTEFLSGKNLRLSIRKEEEEEEEIRQSGFAIRHPSREGIFPKFIISARLLQILGRMFTLSGRDYIQEIVTKLIEGRIAAEYMAMVKGLMEHLELLDYVTNRAKMRAVSDMLEILQMQHFVSICVKVSQKEEENLDFRLCKKIMIAA